MKLSKKLMIFFLLVGIVPALVISVLAYNLASTGLSTQAFSQLQAVRGIKKAQVEAFFSEREGDLSMLAETVMVLTNQQKEITTALIPLTEPRDGQTDSFFNKFIKSYGYYDAFIINAEGDVFYTEAKEADFGTNLVHGPYKDSGLARVFNRAKSKRGFVLEDFSSYAPSNGEPAAFIAYPTYKNNQLVAVVALQLSIEAINKFMQIREGMGETGESYLVGDDKRMRSDSFLDPKGHSVKASFTGSIESNGVDTRAVNNALNNETAEEIIVDYNGNPVLSAYTAVDVGGHNWALISEIDEAEAFAIIGELKFDIICVLLLSIVLIIIVSIKASNAITRPLGGEPDDMHSIAERLAGGDLTQTFKEQQNQSSLYAAMQRMTLTLQTMIADISKVSTDIASSSEETAVVTQQATDLVQLQQQESSQASAATTQMNASILEVARNTLEVSRASEIARDEMKVAIDTTEKTNIIITGLMEDISQATATISSLESQSAQIGSVMDVIRGIADQTNLLALNAAIEAARAGEQGRGFAVVADEVRSLAQKTQNSTGDIENMINQLQSATKQAAITMNSSSQKTKSTLGMAKSLGLAINNVSSVIGSIHDMNIQISSAAEQQSVVSEQISYSMESIKGLSEQTLNGAKQTAESTLLQAELAERLNQLTLNFRVT
ncbi:MAG: methyl-accepting chemotaxis protein [Oceanospirillaceae bacterium]|jgi:methyl-accepting chemotaxis protein